MLQRLYSYMPAAFLLFFVADSHVVVLLKQMNNR